MYNAIFLRSELRAGYSWCVIKRDSSFLLGTSLLSFFCWLLQQKQNKGWEWSPPRRREIKLYISNQCRSFPLGCLNGFGVYEMNGSCRCGTVYVIHGGMGKFYQKEKTHTLKL